MMNMSETTGRNITEEFLKERTSHPNQNHDILHNHIKVFKDELLPVRYEKVFEEIRKTKSYMEMHFGNHM